MIRLEAGRGILPLEVLVTLLWVQQEVPLEEEETQLEQEVLEVLQFHLIPRCKNSKYLFPYYQVYLDNSKKLFLKNEIMLNDKMVQPVKIFN